MYSPHEQPAPIEKIKAKFSAENTLKTQRVVDELQQARLKLTAVTGDTEITHAMKRAIRRFHALDPMVMNPVWDYE